MKDAIEVFDEPSGHEETIIDCQRVVLILLARVLRQFGHEAIISRTRSLTGSERRYFTIV